MSHDSIDPRRAYADWRSSQEPISGEIKEKAPSFSEVSDGLFENLKDQVRERLVNKTSFGTAEAYSVVRELEGEADKVKFGRETLIDLKSKEDGALDYYKTGHTITIPTELGNWDFSLDVSFIKDQQRNKFVLSKISN